MNSLVGDTGFVGSNLLAESRGFFGGLYHSGNIGEAYPPSAAGSFARTLLRWPACMRSFIFTADDHGGGRIF
ncbi:hypothetical protein A7X67_09445 [Clostridium sp. W14A]|nr:hypothetical protein A7X67_09445 [Clostridium sp. W14A]